MLKRLLLLSCCIFWLPLAMGADFADDGSLRLAPSVKSKSVSAPINPKAQTGLVDNGTSLQYVAPPASKGATAKNAPTPKNPVAEHIILFGVSGCPAAKLASDMLKERGIPFTYVDLNSENFRKNYREQLMREFREAGQSRIKNPFLEVYGKAYENPDLYYVIEKITFKK